ncbi:MULTISPECIES: hypothetical protein [Nocardioides]|uniref:Uncharacterized protein n=1 Tax=Nocardioides vastitatis TaxID=2568655 RepID=A0ABW0ZEF3_9ACTN|nr:hypothetical protein [Nocardioides sp.]THI90841.1 hypothetical protein E7Z54_22625 [Nocardioides sp.]
MTTHLDHEHQLEQRLRRTLAAVAATVHEGPTEETVSVPRLRRRRGLLVGVGVTIAAIPLVAAAVVRFGPEYVDRIPPENPIISGTIDGERYWVVDGRETSDCVGSPSGIELIAEENNLVGQEWNTSVVFFGPPTKDGCAPRGEVAPPAYTYDSDGGVVAGDGMLWMGALHPDVDQVRVTLAGGEPFDAKTFEHEGGTYYVLEVPPGISTFTVEYLVDGEVVEPLDGENDEHVVPAD